jgi:hypothetical protein
MPACNFWSFGGESLRHGLLLRLRRAAGSGCRRRLLFRICRNSSYALRLCTPRWSRIFLEFLDRFVVRLGCQIAQSMDVDGNHDQPMHQSRPIHPLFLDDISPTVDLGGLIPVRLRRNAIVVLNFPIHVF